MRKEDKILVKPAKRVGNFRYSNPNDLTKVIVSFVKSSDTFRNTIPELVSLLQRAGETQNDPITEELARSCIQRLLTNGIMALDKDMRLFVPGA